MILVEENAPVATRSVPEDVRVNELDVAVIVRQLNQGPATVANAVQGRMLDDCSDHPVLLIQHRIWREGDHHGQIRLALKVAGHRLADDLARPLTWRVWTRRSGKGSGGN